jgi:hypothetical protein
VLDHGGLGFDHPLTDRVAFHLPYVCDGICAGLDGVAEGSPRFRLI